MCKLVVEEMNLAQNSSEIAFSIKFSQNYQFSKSIYSPKVKTRRVSPCFVNTVFFQNKTLQCFSTKMKFHDAKNFTKQKVLQNMYFMKEYKTCPVSPYFTNKSISPKPLGQPKSHNFVIDRFGTDILIAFLNDISCTRALFHWREKFRC